MKCHLMNLPSDVSVLRLQYGCLTRLGPYSEVVHVLPLAGSSYTCSLYTFMGTTTLLCCGLKINILGIFKTRWKGAGITTSDNYICILQEIITREV